MRSVRIALATVALLAIHAFAQEASAPQPPAAKQSKGTVYIYRYKQFVGSAKVADRTRVSVAEANLDNATTTASNK